MYEANKVNSRLIKELAPEQLTQLLLILVHLECQKHSLQGFHYVSQKITVADGGEDARIELKSFEPSQWFKSNLTIYQCKTSPLGPEACKKEILEQTGKRGKGMRLKPVIKEVLDQGGQYVLFISSEYGKPKAIRDRVNKMKEGAGSKYKLNQFLVYDAQKISEWANDFIPAITFVLECNNKTRPGGFRTWSQWQRDIEFQLKYPFVVTPSLMEKIQWLKDGLQRSNCLRILGHSGIGKSRFIFEALRPSSDNHEQNILNSSVLYVDLSLVTFDSISQYLISNKDSTVATFVIDNCPDQEHIALSTLVRSNSKIKIITADYSLDTDENDACVIFLRKEEQREVVQQMLQTLYQNKYSDEEIRRFVELAEGYPRMVELLQGAIDKGGLENLNPGLPKQFVERLIFGRDKEKEIELNILKCCSIFSDFPFVDDESSNVITPAEGKSIKEVNSYLATLANPNSSHREFVKMCKRIKQSRGIFERRGLRYSVVPTPLAAHLAADWLMEFPDSDFEELSIELTKHGLISSFCKRLQTLDQVDRAKSVVSKLWGPNGPFVTAEVLNSELGSRLFCAVVEVSPETTAESLELSLSKFSDEELKKHVGPGRRYLIWALEKLAFRKETFETAANLLARFAVAENETIGNNATNQFLHLFHVYLPGTEVNYRERVKFIESLKRFESSEYQHLLINALGRALYMGHFDRMLGPEKQGASKQLKDFVPTSWTEIHEYWDYACNSLKSIAVSNTPLRSLAKQRLAESIRWLFENGKGILIAKTIREITHVDTSLWQEAITNLRGVLYHSKLVDADRQVIADLLKHLQPVNIADQIRFAVSIPEWTSADEIGQGDTSSLKAERLVVDLLSRKVDLLPYLPLLVTGEQRQAFSFGKKIGKLIDNPFSFGTAILKALKGTDQSERNFELLSGFLKGCPARERRQLIDFIIKDKELVAYSFAITRAINPDFIDLAKLFPLVDNKEIEPYEFNNFVYGRCLDNLTVGEVILFTKKVYQYGPDGKWAALNVLSQYCHFDQNLWMACRTMLREFVLGFNYLLPFETKGRVDYYRWSMVVMGLLQLGNDDEFAEIISSQIVDASRRSLLSYRSYVSRVVAHLIKENFAIFWKHVSPALIGEEFFYLKEILGTRNGNDLSSEGILFSGDQKVILEWCKANSPTGPKRIGYMMPVFLRQKSGELTWHPFAKTMIDTFGDLEGFLEEVGANLGTFGFVGSVIPYYRDQQKLMKDLFNHRSSTVRKWSKNSFNSLERIIAREMLREEQGDLF